MKSYKSHLTILMAEDDPDDRMLIKEAFIDYQESSDLLFVEDGEQLMDYLYLRGKYKDSEYAPRPSIILLDLNMPVKDGREALAEIKSDPLLKEIPVIVLTTSVSEEDVILSYNLGANSFITKPVTFEGLVDVARTLKKYWLETVKLPPSIWRKRICMTS